MNIKAALLATAAAVSVLATSPAAQAAVVSFSALPGAAIPNPIATSTTGTVEENTFGSVLNDKRSPWLSAGSTVDPDLPTSFYTIVSADASALYEFGSARTNLSFVWGSPDTFNLLTFFLGGFAVDSLALTAGDPIAPASFGMNSATATITGVTFDAVEFSSSMIAFEYANIAAIPLPAAGLLMAGALAGLGALAARRKAA